MDRCEEFKVFGRGRGPAPFSLGPASYMLRREKINFHDRATGVEGTGGGGHHKR